MLRPRSSGIGGGALVGYSSNEEELRLKVQDLARSRYGNTSPASMKKLFMSYDANGDGAINKSELKELLSDADVGNWVTRGTWVDAIFDRVDANKNGVLTWEEYKAAAGVKDEAPPPAPTPAPPAPAGSGGSDGSAADIATGIGEGKADWGTVNLTPSKPAAPIASIASSSVSTTALLVGAAIVVGGVVLLRR